MTISSYSIPIWIAVIFIVSLATVTYWGSKKVSTRAFAFSMLIVAFQTASIAYFIFEKDYKIENFGIRLTFFSGIVVTTAIIYFIKSFVDDKKPSKWLITLLVLVCVILFYLIFYTGFITTGPILLKQPVKDMVWGWGYGPYSYIVLIFSLVYYFFGVKMLISAHKSKTDLATRRSITYMVIGLFIGVLSLSYFNTILPQLGNWDWVWFGPTTGVVWVSILAYSIIKYHQMSVRVVVTEVLVIAMTIAAFMNIFISDLLGIGGTIFMFLAFSILGIYLIRSAILESEQRELLSNLNTNLQKQVIDQTKEIRASYQVERNARLELEKIDEAKNQFILITQHHLRTPITSIKWQLESILGGTYGPVDTELKKAMGDMSESIGRLNHLIDNLLSISALRSGIETLSKTMYSMKFMVEDIVNELKREIDRKHLTMYMPTEKEVWPAVSMDKDRMREAIFVIVENAVRYNNENGSITISGSATENTFELSVENTGSELTPEDKKKIFSELFYRSSQAQTSHPTGMGIGLSMAQAIIEAHKGTISLGSRKEGGGVKVVVTLPY